MGWAAIAVIGTMFVAPFLLALWARERAFQADARRPDPPYDWAHEDDILGVRHDRTA
jgi:hypothetical protein